MTRSTAVEKNSPAWGAVIPFPPQEKIHRQQVAGRKRNLSNQDGGDKRIVSSGIVIGEKRRKNSLGKDPEPLRITPSKKKVPAAKRPRKKEERSLYTKKEKIL